MIPGSPDELLPSQPKLDASRVASMNVVQNDLVAAAAAAAAA
jgi:hypothetical protein